TARDFDWQVSDALPPNLQGVFSDEPLWIDARWARHQTQFSHKDPRFQDAVADLAAPLHGPAKDDLVGGDVRQHRSTMRLARGAIATLMALALALAGATAVAMSQRDTAIKEQQIATSRLLAAESQNDLNDRLDLALLLSRQAYQT